MRCFRSCHTRAPLTVLFIAFGLIFFTPAPAHALEKMCDSSYENCRTTLLNLIKAEKVAIDIGMWFMEDARYATELTYRKQAGVPIRILMDPRSNDQHPSQPPILAQLAAAGIQMRKRTASGIEHWKVMIFEGQNTVYFGSANFSAEAFVPTTPYVNYTDETAYFTDDPTFVNGLKTRFDDAWVNTSSYANYANVVTPLTRRYPTYAVDPALNLPPGEDFIDRTVARINAETRKIDAIMYRIADDRITNALIAAKKRGIPIRLIVDPSMYHDYTRIDVSFHFDRLYAAGIPMKFTVHQGLNHGKVALLYGQALSIFGSSNWTTPSANSQHENNYFAKQAYLFNYLVSFFERRWNNASPVLVAETGPFVPQLSHKPVYSIPALAATGVATSGSRLRWYGNVWAQYYDVYLGTTADPPLLAANLSLGPSRTTTDYKYYSLPALKPGTTYYWKIVSKTEARLERPGPIWTFTTSGSAPAVPAGTPRVVLWMSDVPAGNIHGDWIRSADGTAAGGALLQNPDRVRAKIAPASASPANYFDVAFNASAGVAYHLWVRMRAQGNSLANDSVHVQFSDATDAVGNAVARIGTSGSFEPVLQNGPSGAAPHGWGWSDNGWGSVGPQIYFRTSGTHVLRIQQREDGAAIDQIVLSPDTYLMSAPGPHTDDSTILPRSGN